MPILDTYQSPTSTSSPDLSELNQRPLVIVLAGATSSGKSTIANALATIFSNVPLSAPTTQAPHSLSIGDHVTSSSPRLTTSLHAADDSDCPNPLTILHLDDFYLPDNQIPTLPSGLQDWDCIEALDIPQLIRTLTYLLKLDKSEDSLSQDLPIFPPPKPDSSSSGAPPPSPIAPATITRLRAHILRTWPRHLLHRPLLLLEGIFLLSPPFLARLPLAIRSVLDVKVMLRVEKEVARRRRAEREGYVTLEGFWKDPEGYFDGVVWPGFERVYGPGEEDGVLVMASGDEEGGLDGVLESVVRVVRERLDSGG